jgi:hypothetical protein
MHAMRRFAAPLLLMMLAASCVRAPKPIRIEAPGRMRFALASVSDLGASAVLIAQSGAALSPLELTRASDGVSFSGFISAAPGDYTLEIAFTGVIASGDRVFLGRYVSDGFTIVAGRTAEPKFTAPLDPIGRPGDHGDDDRDGLGVLDELLWGTDPKNADSDGDSVQDGADCDPKNGSSMARVAPGGSLEDCDADRYRRPDAPFGDPGDDCNDRDPMIHPGAMDDCADNVDADCNPATCPSSDMQPPAIASVVPADGAVAGCHTSVAADITDDSDVASASAALPDEGMSLVYTMARDPAHAEHWVMTGSFNTLASLRTTGLLPGRQRVALRAQDMKGNMASMDLTLDFHFDVPTVTSMTPAAIGQQSAPFMVTVAAASGLGLAGVDLMIAPKVGTVGLYAGDMAMKAGSAMSSPATFTVNPSSLPDGEYLVYPIVRDTAGNASQPYPGGISPLGGQADLQIEIDYQCIPPPGGRRTTPARVLLVGAASPYAPSTIREHLDQALMLASMQDPNAKLVSINGFGLRADGKIALDDAASYEKQLIYSFYNDATQHAVTVNWYTPAFTTFTNPHVDPDAGNVASGQEPMQNPTTIVDSDVAAMKFTSSANCGVLMGDANDHLLYQSIGGQLVLTVYNRAGKYWHGTATAPVTEIYGCQP